MNSWFDIDHFVSCGNYGKDVLFANNIVWCQEFDIIQISCYNKKEKGHSI